MISSASDPVIINAAVPLWLRFTHKVMTIIIWLFYLYLIQDAFIFMRDITLWALGGFDDSANYASFKIVPTLISYAEVVLVFGIIYISWARYNQIRFRGKNRRTFSPPVTSAELSETFGIPPTAVEIWQRTKNLIMYHDDNGRLTKINAA